MAEEESLLADAESTPSEESTTEATPWAYAEGITGEGDKPDWFKDSKYKSVADQAKAYTDLESKLGGFTGSPEGDYELSMPDGIEGDWIDGDPLMEGFQTWAKDNNLSQDKFTDLLHLYVNNEASMMGTDRESELSAFGENAESRLKNISDYAKANLSEDDYQGILSATTTAAGAKAVEALIAKTRGLKVPTDMGESASGITHSEIRARIADPKYSTDKAFRDETTKMYEQLLGKGPKQTVIG